MITLLNLSLKQLQVDPDEPFLRSELEGVRNEVQQDLKDSALVHHSMLEHACARLVNRDEQLDLLFLRLEVNDIKCFLNALDNVGTLNVELECVVVELGQIKQVVDQVGHHHRREHRVADEVVAGLVKLRELLDLVDEHDVKHDHFLELLIVDLLLLQLRPDVFDQFNFSSRVALFSHVVDGDILGSN